MEALPDNVFLKYNSNTLQQVREIFGYDKPDAMAGAIQILEEWLNKQHHIKNKAFPKDYLERMLIHSKGSIEQSKQKLDRICALRTLIPDMFEDLDVDELSSSCQDALLDILVPTMTPDHGRLFMLKGQEIETTPHKLREYLRLHLIAIDYLQLYDYDDGLVYFGDWRNSHPGAFVKSVNVADFKKIVDIALGGYKVRVRGIHLLTESPVINVLVTFLKQVLSAKLGSRIHVHKTMDTVYEHIPKSVFPAEYGGDEKPIKELREKFLAALKSTEFQEYRKEIHGARTDLALRPKDSTNYDDYLGVSGTFRNLTVD